MGCESFITHTPKRDLEYIAPAGRIGVITLATDFNIEHDLAHILPDDVRTFTSRVRNRNPLTIDNLRSMAPNICRTADCILPGTDLDLMIYACTSGTVAIGEDKITELIHQSRPGIAVTNPVKAAVRAFDSLKAKKISILTPYTETVNREVTQLFEEKHYQVNNITGFGFEDDTAMTFISPDDIIEAALATSDPNSDLLFISCTALRSAQVVERLETLINKPVLTSNQVLAWDALRILNYPRPVPNFGTLLHNHLIKTDDQ